VVIATSLNFSFAATGQRIATVKSAPFAVAKDQLEAISAILRDRGPIIQARPVRNPTIGVLYTDPVNGERARQLFENVTTQRLERFGLGASFVLSSLEDEASVSRALHHLLRPKPAVIMVASTTAPAGPEDVIGRAMTQIGGTLERFLAPVEPGNLLMLAYKDDIPIVSAPGCFRSAKANVMDLVLPPLLARYRVTSWEVACMGHGGLLG
jgi:molybdenum cofactor cytidylyltransferase